MEMQIKITIRHQYKESKNKKLAIANVGEDITPPVWKTPVLKLKTQYSNTTVLLLDKKNVCIYQKT